MKRHYPLTEKDIERLREYDPFNAWICEHWVGLVDEEYEKATSGAWAKQVMFLRDDIRPLFGTGMHHEDVNYYLGRVISTHYSKSIELPVVEFERKDIGLRIILRNNFYNWKMSVISKTPIEADFKTLFHTTPPIDREYTGDPLARVYFEGFPDDLIFGYYQGNNRQFSAEIHGKYHLFMAIHTMLMALGVITPLEWRTREAYRKQLDERYDRKSERAKEKERNSKSA